MTDPEVGPVMLVGSLMRDAAARQALSDENEILRRQNAELSARLEASRGEVAPYIALINETEAEANRYAAAVGRLESELSDLQNAKREGAREALTRLMQKCEQGAFSQGECDCGVDMTDLPTREDIRAFRDSEFPLPSPRTETPENEQ